MCGQVAGVMADAPVVYVYQSQSQYANANGPNVHVDQNESQAAQVLFVGLSN